LIKKTAKSAEIHKDYGFPRISRFSLELSTLLIIHHD